jgi:hypothetical protein
MPTAISNSTKNADRMKPKKPKTPPPTPPSNPGMNGKIMVTPLYGHPEIA